MVDNDSFRPTCKVKGNECEIERDEKSIKKENDDGKKGKT